MIKISLCLTTYNRVELTMKCFEQVLDDSWVDEVVIVDDASDINIYNQLAEAVKDMPKVKLYRNDINLDCYANKRESVSKAINEWVIIFDSDNIMTKEYVTKLYEQTWVKDTIHAPVWAYPTFNYTEFSGMYVSHENVSEFMGSNMFETALNTCNYFCNRDFYLKCFDANIDPHSSDSIFMNMQWLKHGGYIHFVPDLIYTHLIHDNSHYKHNCHKSPEFYEKIVQELKNMK